MNKKELEKQHSKLINKISKVVVEARKDLVKTINNKIVNSYWTIGKYIVEDEQKGKERADYGSKLMKVLSNELSSNLGKGFSRSNLQNMRLFYLAYPKSQTASGKLS